MFGVGQPGGLGGGANDVRRKKSLVKPDRERIDPNHRLWHYREHAAADIDSGGMDVMPSTTGNAPPGLRRGKSLLAREPTDSQESGLNIFKRSATLRRKSSTNTSANQRIHGPSGAATGKSATNYQKQEKLGCLGDFAPGPKDAWMVYCYLLTVCVPGFVLRGVFGKHTREAQRAWREKIGLVSLVVMLMAVVGFVTFGFTQTVCGATGLRIKGGEANSGYLIINGYAYDFSTWNHPAAGTYFNGSTNPLYTDQWMAGGKDASFLFQKTNDHCSGILTPATGTTITYNGTNMGWYFPCNLHDQNDTSAVNITGYDSSTNCHDSLAARTSFAETHPSGEIYYTWGQIRNSSRNLIVYESSVLDLSLLNWMQSGQVNYPSFFDELKTPNVTFQGKDVTMLLYRAGMKAEAACLQDIITVGFIDVKSIGCVASDVLLYLSLIFILGVVLIKFGMAVMFGWFFSWRLGNFKQETYAQRMARAAEIENWTDDIYRPAPSRYRPNTAPGDKAGRKTNKGFLPTTSRFSKADHLLVNNSRPSTAYGQVNETSYRPRQASTYGGKLLKTSPPGSPMLRSSRSSTSLPFNRDESRMSLAGDNGSSNCPFPLGDIIPQPPIDYEPFGFPLVQTICLVTAYSESIEGLRTTLDSLATTDYPNSHKVILVICDGMVKGSGSKLVTPDIVLGMMKELVTPEHEVEAHSYVAIADGHKRHNMAKVYAGFYDYDNNTVESSKQQKCPIVLVAKVGNPLEVNDAKPGNRGKRDSQIVLMSFLQKVMFDERMTTFDYEFFNSIWRITGVSPDRYETVLCVDADTKVFPDSLTRMNACMVNDPEIMGLCGETKIANKTETWVTMIQVFEYYISHHMTKAFESMFGGVTCLPGCFSIYRIKAPKGETGYWVPILANPDICEHYAENVVDTLHKKNLLLLGEDRYLTTLMLKTFPKRKMVFCPQAVCKTVVPDTFRILLSQRRRWINSTVHNLFELVLVRDLCGTFCFSMQFVVGMELAGTLVLPAAISFTIYLIIVTIIPGTVKPVLSLILLAFILGLPGLLIVITSRKFVYVGWMGIYLLSLPIWNFVLPAYAFWHFDDFSWGETRKIEGGEKGGDAGHGDKDGVFDSSHIVMKRWVEFERERMWKSGQQSRDSYYDVVQRSNSPRREGNMPRDRYSMASTHETYFSGAVGSESAFLGRPSQSFASMSLLGSPGETSQTQLETPGGGPFRGRDNSPASSESADHYTERYRGDARDEVSPMISPSHYVHTSPLEEAFPPRTGMTAGQRQPSEDDFRGGSSRSPPPAQQYQSKHYRRISLVDNGPIGSSVDSHTSSARRVSRPSRRQSSGYGAPAAGGSGLSNLPPGAAPPAHGQRFY